MFAFVLLAVALNLDIAAEVNRLRADPAGFAQRLQALRRHYKGLLFEEPGRIPILTIEGVAALDDAIAELKRTAPLKPLKYSEPLELAASGHAANQGPRGLVGHTGTDGSTPPQRINRHLKQTHATAETIAFGRNRTGFDVIALLLIDDGLPSRGHRAALLSPNYQLLGAACGPHRDYGAMCVLDFASMR